MSMIMIEMITTLIALATSFSHAVSTRPFVNLQSYQRNLRYRSPNPEDTDAETKHESAKLDSFLPRMPFEFNGNGINEGFGSDGWTFGMDQRHDYATGKPRTFGAIFGSFDEASGFGTDLGTLGKRKRLGRAAGNVKFFGTGLGGVGIPLIGFFRNSQAAVGEGSQSMFQRGASSGLDVAGKTGSFGIEGGTLGINLGHGFDIGNSKALDSGIAGIGPSIGLIERGQAAVDGGSPSIFQRGKLLGLGTDREYGGFGTGGGTLLGINERFGLAPGTKAFASGIAGIGTRMGIGRNGPSSFGERGQSLVQSGSQSGLHAAGEAIGFGTEGGRLVMNHGRGLAAGTSKAFGSGFAGVASPLGLVRSGQAAARGDQSLVQSGIQSGLLVSGVDDDFGTRKGTIEMNQGHGRKELILVDVGFDLPTGTKAFGSGISDIGSRINFGRNGPTFGEKGQPFVQSGLQSGLHAAGEAGVFDTERRTHLERNDGFGLVTGTSKVSGSRIPGIGLSMGLVGKGLDVVGESGRPLVLSKMQSGLDTDIRAGGFGKAELVGGGIAHGDSIETDGVALGTSKASREKAGIVLFRSDGGSYAEDDDNVGSLISVNKTGDNRELVSDEITELSVSDDGSSEKDRGTKDAIPATESNTEAVKEEVANEKDELVGDRITPGDSIEADGVDYNDDNVGADSVDSNVSVERIGSDITYTESITYTITKVVDEDKSIVDGEGITEDVVHRENTSTEGGISDTKFVTEDAEEVTEAEKAVVSSGQIEEGDSILGSVNVTDSNASVVGDRIAEKDSFEKRITEEESIVSEVNGDSTAESGTDSEKLLSRDIVKADVNTGAGVNEAEILSAQDDFVGGSLKEGENVGLVTIGDGANASQVVGDRMLNSGVIGGDLAEVGAEVGGKIIEGSLSEAGELVGQAGVGAGEEGTVGIGGVVGAIFDTGIVDDGISKILKLGGSIANVGGIGGKASVVGESSGAGIVEGFKEIGGGIANAGAVGGETAMIGADFRAGVMEGGVAKMQEFGDGIANAGTIGGEIARGAVNSGAGTIGGGIANAGAIAGGIANAGAMAGGIASADAMAGGIAKAGAIAGGIANAGAIAGGIANAGAITGGIANAGAMAGGIANAGAMAGGIANAGSIAGGIANAGTMAGDMENARIKEGGVLDIGSIAGGILSSEIGAVPNPRLSFRTNIGF